MIEIHKCNTYWSTTQYYIVDKEHKVAFEVLFWGMSGKEVLPYESDVSFTSLMDDIHIAKKLDIIVEGTYLELLVLFGISKSEVEQRIENLAESKRAGSGTRRITTL